MISTEQLTQEPIQILLPEYSRDVPSTLEARRLANAASENRVKLITRAKEFGLNPDFLTQQREFLVGPFVSPAPLSTTFAGRSEHLDISLKTGNELARGLSDNGYTVNQSVVVLLGMTEVPTKGGQEAMDILVLPKNANENKRAPLLDKTQKGTVYAAATTSIDTINKAAEMAKASFTTYLDLKGVPKAEKRKKQPVLDAVQQDIKDAMADALKDGKINDTQVYYLAFATALNKRMLERINPDKKLPQTFVDLDYYDPFLRYGIADITTFTQKLKSTGFFQDDPGFIKMVEGGKSRVMKLQTIEEEDIVLQFVDSNERVRFSDIQSSPTKLAPCKELSYMLTQGTFVPVIYGSQNSGEYYQPYSYIRQRLLRIGLSPVLYRTQPQIPDGYQGIDTIFDFYQNVLAEKE
jgi:hypothetical protein